MKPYLACYLASAVLMAAGIILEARERTQQRTVWTRASEDGATPATDSKDKDSGGIRR
jgi:hypothetical protein